jgi:prephenate dehydrogenase
LPQLAAAALLDATVDQPGWIEARKVAARPYATVTAALAYHDEAKSLGEAALGNRESMLRVLDSYMASLQKLRDDINSRDDQSVAEFIEGAVKARDRWLHERTRADWQNTVTETDSTPFGERLNQMIFGNLMNRNKKRK